MALAFLVPLAAAVLQAPVAGLISVGGAYPSLPVLVAGSWAVAVGAREALWWAFIGGLAMDVLSGGPLGAFTVAYLPAVLIAGSGERSAAKPVPLLTGAVLVALAALVARSIYLGELAYLGRPLGGPALGLTVTAGVALYTGLLALAAYPLARLGRRLTEKESPF